MRQYVKKALQLSAASAAVLAQVAAVPADAFCGFYVAQADSKLFNKSSKVVLARDGDHTAITMASDYEGDAKEFALVIPVPTFIERKQIGVVEMKTIDHIDAYSAPRLVEYSDMDPCEPPPMPVALAVAKYPSATPSAAPERRGVTVEASYDVAEYDVSILAAKESEGLVAWLTENNYKIPAGAEAVLGSYIKQNMHFFIAKVNLDRMKLIGAGYLRPLQVRYETNKFMLPLRLGTVNANGPQDLIVFALTKRGRVEAVNYPNMKLPTGMDVPLYVKDDFGPFYKAMFDRAVEKQNMRGVFVEYAWNMGFCDPCSAQPLGAEEQAALGARWIEGGRSPSFITRLHVRYDAKSFPEDLAFEETSDVDSYQARYVLRHPWHGGAACKAATEYRAALPKAFAAQADNLVSLTGWPRAEVVARMSATGQAFKER